MASRNALLGRGRAGDAPSPTDAEQFAHALGVHNECIALPSKIGTSVADLPQFGATIGHCALPIALDTSVIDVLVNRFQDARQVLRLFDEGLGQAARPVAADGERCRWHGWRLEPERVPYPAPCAMTTIGAPLAPVLQPCGKRGQRNAHRLAHVRQLEDINAPIAALAFTDERLCDTHAMGQIDLR